VEGALARDPKSDSLAAVRQEIGPVGRSLASHYFEGIRFAPEVEAELARLSKNGFVVHVMRTTAWVNYLYLAWAMVRRGLPPIRAVVNLRRWFTRPWRRAAQRGDLEVRLTYARRKGGSALVFLKKSLIGSAHGRSTKEDPFPALVSFTRKSDRPVYLVPELFVWEKSRERLKPAVLDYIFGSPEAPGFLHSVVAFWRNYRRAQFRIGDPVDLRKFIEERPDAPDALIARKVRGALYHHLARETRAVFGPPPKSADRLIEEALRDRTLNRSLQEHAAEAQRRMESVIAEARRDLESIAARPSTTVVGLAVPVLHWVFNRIYDGIDVDEAGLERAMKSAARAPIVLCPSHKSHVDYLVMSYVLWNRGYSVPLVAAGTNLSFFPLGPFFRRGGAFFLRRSFKGDKVYTAAFRAYIKRLVHEGVHQEFFLEGGRSRTGKLLTPKLGMLTWEVDAVLEGAANDIHFVPVSIDYEKVVESGSYSAELSGGEKRPEDFKALLSTHKVLRSNYGRIHLRFDEPVSLLDFIQTRGLSPIGMTEEQKKSLVRALGNRIIYGISRVSTVTPYALVSAALLAHRGRGAPASELTERIALLRRIAAEEGYPISTQLRGAPASPTVNGPVQAAMRSFIADQSVRIQEVKGETIYIVPEERRAQLSFYKNTLMNLVAPQSLAANAVLTRSPATREQVQEAALFLSRLLKFEFVYRVGATFETSFSNALEGLRRSGLVKEVEGRIAAGDTDQLGFMADLSRDFLEGYLAAALTLKDLVQVGPMEPRAFVKAALETGRAEYLAGRISTPEALSKSSVENAVLFFLDQQILAEEAKRLRLGPAAAAALESDRLANLIGSFTSR
jgi:glycerol-3-phosphate O-acyltransferase